MKQTEIDFIISTNDSLLFHLISGENYIGKFEKSEQAGYLRLTGTNITFPIWAVKRIKTTK